MLRRSTRLIHEKRHDPELMLFIGDKKEMIMLLKKSRSKYYALVCIGRKRHYRKDGTCKHTESVLADIKPEIRDLVKIDLWGGRSNR